MSFLDKLPKLPKSIPFLGKKGAESEYFFSLNVGEDKVTASVWGLVGKKLHIVNTASSKYGTEDELILSSNYALDDALADFEPEPTKILFGVPDFWLQDDDLKPEYLRTLRRMVKELDITPMAYVSTSHSISHLLQKQQGVPLTGILVEIADPLNVAVVKAGKVLAVKSQKRTENLPNDIEKALMSFADVEVMPSKILIYGTENMEKFKEEMISFSWMAQLPFLHLPKIESLEENVVIKAVSFAGASEVYPEAQISPNNITIGSLLATGSAGPLRSAGSLLEHDNLKSTDTSDMGFAVGDISDKSSVVSRQSSERNYPEEDDFGEETAVDRNMQIATAEREIEHRRPIAPMPDDYGGKASPLSSLKSTLMMPLGVFAGGGGMGMLAGLLKVLALPLIIIIGLGAFILFGPKADITVFVDPRTLDKETTITADPAQKTVDEENKKIPGSIVETDVSGTSKGTATGKKKVGDAAKGSVVMYNKTNSPKSFSAGTVLVGPNNIEFKLDSSVNVASKSAVTGGISFGKGNVNVTATAIGPDGNLKADPNRELTVKGSPTTDYSAVVDSELTGGVSKDVTIVTSDDQKKLLAQLSSDLRAKAKDDLQGKLKGDAKILEESLAEKILKQAFTKNVNDQATDFSLNLSENFRGTSYSDTDLRQIVSKLVETNVPDGYLLDLTKTETQADVTKIEKDGRLIFTAKFKAKLMPKLDENQIKKDIAFKTPQATEDKLKTIENVIGAEIKLSPTLPGPLARLPILTQNITLHVTAK